jgi:hypothetical protein
MVGKRKDGDSSDSVTAEHSDKGRLLVNTAALPAVGPLKGPLQDFGSASFERRSCSSAVDLVSGNGNFIRQGHYLTKGSGTRRARLYQGGGSA